MSVQAITTRYIGPSNSRGSRILAKAAGGAKKITSYNNALNSAQNHKQAAMSLASELNWRGTWQMGDTKEGHVFVCTPPVLHNEFFIVM